MTTRGTELMNQIADGTISQLPSDFLQTSVTQISQAAEELIEVGARIRPLLLGGKRVGWVRGIHLSERKAIKRWITDDTENITQLLRIGTTLTEDEIADLNMVELRSVSRVIRAMTDSDVRLFPYLSPFVTTSASEQLWYSRGITLTSFTDREVRLPDGKHMRLLCASDQAQMWAMLCNYRIEAKRRLDASFNAVLTIRPWVGKGADPLNTDLKRMAKALQTDSFDPWSEIINTTGAADYEDGWAHSEDSSHDGMKRELEGFLKGDKHERTVRAWEDNLRRKAEEDKAKRESAMQRKRAMQEAPTRLTPVNPQTMQAKAHAAEAERAKVQPKEQETESSLMSRLAKYR